MWYKKHFNKIALLRASGILITGIAFQLFVLTGCENLEDKPETLEGTWQCTENSSVYGYQAYDVKISYLKADSSQIGINNFYNLGNEKRVIAEVSIWELTLTSQTIDGFSITGSGTISGDLKLINLSYKVNDGSGTIDQVTATYEK